MTNPSADIMVPLTADPNGPQAWVYAEAVEITRQGTKPVPNVDGVEDNWQIGIPVRAALANDGELVLRDGAEITIPSPIASIRMDVADILFDSEVQQALSLIKSISLRLMNGSLKAQP